MPLLLPLAALLLLAACAPEQDTLEVEPCKHDNDCSPSQYCDNSDPRRAFCAEQDDAGSADAGNNDADTTPDPTDDTEEPEEPEEDLCAGVTCEPPAPQCSGTTLITYSGGDTCNPETGECTPLQENPLNCAAQDQICDPRTLKCITDPNYACLSDDDCAAQNKICDFETWECVLPPDNTCLSHLDCPFELLCDTDTGKCQQCLSNTDCTSSDNCIEGLCIPSVECSPDALETNDLGALSSPLYPGVVEDLNICQSDIDWFSFTVHPEGASTTISIEFHSNDGDLNLHLLDADEETIISSTTTRDLELIATLLFPGDYKVRVDSPDPLANTEYNLNLYLDPDTCALDGTNDSEFSSSLLPDHQSRHVFCQDAGDTEEDWVSFFLVEGENIRVDLNSDLGTPFDLELHYELSVVAQETGTSERNTLEFTPETSGLYYLRISPGSFFSTLEIRESYTLNLVR